LFRLLEAWLKLFAEVSWLCSAEMPIKAREGCGYAFCDE
jgi:hypothetical protein